MLDAEYANTPLPPLTPSANACSNPLSTPVDKPPPSAAYPPAGAKYDATYTVPAVTATGVVKFTCCQPEPDSLANVADANFVPDADHKVPTWVPVLFAPLKNRIPVTEPLASARNFTPSSTADPSAALAFTGADADDQIEHAAHDGANGVTAPDAADAGPVPTALVAETVNVYAVPFVKPLTVADVAGGLPLTVTEAWAADPTKGVTV